MHAHTLPHTHIHVRTHQGYFFFEAGGVLWFMKANTFITNFSNQNEVLLLNISSS